LKLKSEEEEDKCQQFEVAHYTQTIKKAENEETIDQLLFFVEEFAKRLR